MSDSLFTSGNSLERCSLHCLWVFPWLNSGHSLTTADRLMLDVLDIQGQTLTKS